MAISFHDSSPGRLNLWRLNQLSGVLICATSIAAAREVICSLGRPAAV